MDIKLIIGLGNPGDAYKNTLHNAGWMTVDKIAERYHAQWRIESRFSAMTTQIRIQDTIVNLMKPLTFMNLSGNSVGPFCSKKGILPNELIIINDDLAFTVGTIRIREAGSHNGHNGLRDIIRAIGTNQFPRIRVGIAAEKMAVHGDEYKDYVLHSLPPKQHETFLVGVELAADAAEWSVKNGVQAAMNRFNKKQSKPPKEDNNQ